MPRKADSKKEEKALNLKQDLFCHYFVQNNLLRGNATLSYAEAYGYDLDSLPKDDAVYKGKGETRKLVESSSYDKAYFVCATEGNRHLKKPHIQKLCIKLYNSLLKDDVVDAKLAKHIMQDDDMTVSVTAIREYNKLRGRIIDKKSLTDAQGKPLPIIGLSVHVPDTTKK